MAGKFNYFRHSVSTSDDPKMRVFANLLERRSKEAYYYYFKLLELCASESIDGQTEFTFHETTLRAKWETNTKGVRDMCELLTLSTLVMCESHASHVVCHIPNLPKYLGLYDAKESKEKKRKVNNILEASTLSVLFSENDEIQKWLLTGTDSAQKELLEKHSHHVLAEEIKKAYLWQLEKAPRKAGSFLITWMSNKKTTAFNPGKAQAGFKNKSNGVVATPLNPTGNPYIQEAIEKGYIA